MSGTVELQSSSYVKACSGRPEFQIRMKKGWDSPQNFHVVGLKNGLLMLHLGCGGSTSQFDGTLGLVGGLLGGKIGRLVGSAIEKASESPLAAAENNFSMYSDQDLIKKVKRKEYPGSLIAPYDGITAASIDHPGRSGWTRGGVVAAVVSLREKSLGKMTWEICDQQSVLVASEFLPAKLGERVQVNIEFDRESMKYVPSK